MSRRSYGQACAMAYTLDLIGERWTLLIVRDLLLGPLRFSDMLDRLPGLSRNLLSARLQHLEAEGLVVRRRLAPPAASSVYELTELGRGLEGPLLALAGWGLQHGLRRGHGLEGKELPDLLGLAFRMQVRPERLDGLDDELELVIAGVPVTVTLVDGRARVERGTARRPAVRLSGPPDALAQALFGGRLEAAAGRLEVDGAADDVTRVMGAFGVVA